MTTPSPLRDQVIRIWIWITMASLVVCAVVLFGVSWMPLDAVKVRLDALAADGSADPITPEWLGRMAIVFRVAAAGILTIGGLLYWLRGRVQHACNELFASAVSLATDARRSLRESLGEEDALHLIALVAILLFAVVLRLRFLSQPIRWDEAYGFTTWTSKPFYVAMSSYWVTNHVLYTLLSHVAYVLFGSALWSLRLPAFVAGILLVLATYAAMRVFYQKDAALVTAGWIAAASPFIEYSANGRGYTLIGLAFTLSLMLARYLKHHSNTSAWWLLGGFCVMGLYAIPTAFYPFGAIVMWLVFSALLGDTTIRRGIFLRKVSLMVFGIILVTGVLYSPAVLTPRADLVFDYAAPAGLADLTQGLLPWFFPGVWNLWNADLPHLVRAVLLMGVMTALLVHHRLTTDRVPLLVAAALWCIPILLIHRAVPTPRHWLVLSVLYVGLASAGLVHLLSVGVSKMRITRTHLSRVWSVLAVVACASLGWRVVSTQSVQLINPPEVFLDAEQISDFLQGYLRQGDTVLAALPANAPLEYYFIRRGIPRTYLLDAGITASRRVLLVAHEPQQQTLSTLLGKAHMREGTFTIPQPIKQYPSSTLYEMQRRRE